MTWSESLDEALCFGWIDSVRKSTDEYSYQIRFMPRKKESVWSPVNIEKIAKLTNAGLMQEARITIFKNNLKAWEHFESLSPSYKKHSIHWVIS